VRGSEERHNGFTLLEIMIVAAILGIVALAAVPSFVSTSDGEAKLDLAAAEVASAIRFARGETMRTGTVHGAKVTVSNDKVRVFRLDGGSSRVFDVRHPVDKKLYDVRLSTGTFTSGVDVAVSDFRFGGSATPHEAVGFDASGAPVRDQDVSAIMDSGQVQLTAGAESRTVTVAPVTGRVTIQ
jgi:prepilin-type N-terminal cleavage/methylation domain-containing protein